jgi:hypothetical protein
MKQAKHVLLLISAIFILLLSGASYAGTENKRSIGMLLGDPIALSLTIPVSEENFLNIHGGVWAWKFWHDTTRYDTPFLSVDYAWRTPVKQIPLLSYIGAGIAIFFDGNPKDDKEYDACAAIRIPFGFTFYSNKDFSVGFEIAPIYQFLPAYNAKPYGIDLNGGFTLMFFY